MTERKYISKIYNDYTHFGGLIYPSDFNTENSSGNIAERIIADLHFDNKCKKAAENRDNRKTQERK